MPPMIKVKDLKTENFSSAIRTMFQKIASKEQFTFDSHSSDYEMMLKGTVV
jgi:hypothetical protein